MKAKEKNEWRRVLLEIYRDNWQLYSNKCLDKKHPLAIKLKISEVSLKKSISFLREHKLVYDDSNLIYLSKAGFNVARETQKEEKDTFQQITIVLFTFVLTSTAVFEFLYLSHEKDFIIWGYTLTKNFLFWGYFVTLFIGILITYLIFKRATK